LPVETLGEALSYGWRITARCAAGKQDGMVRHPECRYREEFDMSTLVWTRGRGSPRYLAEFDFRYNHTRLRLGISVA
jgi:hypothetical protein